MSGVERHGYWDSQASAAITETILKERSQLRKHYREQEAQGKLIPLPETPPPMMTSLIDRVGIPEFVNTIKADPSQHMAFQISKNMATSNPGYITRDGSKIASTMKRDFIYGEEEIEFMKQQEALKCKSHNRRQDEFTKYVEASAKVHLLLKSS